MGQSATPPPGKLCTGPCGKVKPLSEFRPDAAYADGHRNRCRECRNEADRDRPQRKRKRKRPLRAPTDATRAADRRRYRARGGNGAVMQRYRAKIRAKVFAHYGTVCACPGCHATKDLTIDHIGGGGMAHRRDMFGHRGGLKFYLWLIREGFPSGFQTMCRPCNSSKANGERCRLAH